MSRVLTRLHNWPGQPAAAAALQRRLADRLDLRPLTAPPRLFGGIDVAVSADGRKLVAGIVVWDAATDSVVERRSVVAAARFPYVPGLLSFREAPAVIATARRLSQWPDVFICDGQGLAHPRRFGLACHVGLWLATPTFGCAKSRLCGTHHDPGNKRGSAAPLMLDGQCVGVVLRTRERVNPVYVSPGHLCDLDSAARASLMAAPRFRIPEPTRLAHQFVTASRRRLDQT